MNTKDDLSILFCQSVCLLVHESYIRPDGLPAVRVGTELVQVSRHSDQDQAGGSGTIPPTSSHPILECQDIAYITHWGMGEGFGGEVHVLYDIGTVYVTLMEGT